MSERPPKGPPNPIQSASSDIVFVGPEEDAESKKTSEDLGETWMPAAVRKCKMLFDQIEALTHARGRSWQPELNVVLSQYFQIPIKNFRAVVGGARVAEKFDRESRLLDRVGATIDSFNAVEPLHALRRRGKDFPVTPPFSPAEFYKILQQLLELLSKREHG